MLSLAITDVLARCRQGAAALAAGLLIVVAMGLTGAAGAAASNGGTASPIDTSDSGGVAPTAPSSSSSKRGSTAALPTIVHVICVPKAACSGNPHQVTTGGRLEITGTTISAGMLVVFPVARGAHAARAPIATLHNSSLGLVVAVPRAAASGKIYITEGGRRSKSYGPISIVGYKLHPPPPPKPAPAPAPAAPTATSTTPTTATGSPFAGQGMWIWYVDQSDGGNLADIIAQAKAAGVTTVYIKSSDGSTNFWSQFTPALVQTLHANGLKVCAWQYVYGTYPVGEADLGAEAVADGADCLVIDAEIEYEGRYASAQTYIDTLRSKIGPSFPVGLASFPFVYDHESEPYSVFLGPGGAQYNLPQMYWQDIGVSVDTVYADTWISNRIYARPILPLGQTYSNPSESDILRFREEAVDYGAAGWSFWDWQDTASAGWAALAAPLAPLTTVTPNATWPDLGQGNTGDQVLWMQEHLAAAIPAQATTGIFDATTAANLETFQTSHGLPATGTTTSATWQALLSLTPIAVDWAGSGPSSAGSPPPTTTSSSTSTTSTSATVTTLSDPGT